MARDYFSEQQDTIQLRKKVEDIKQGFSYTTDEKVIEYAKLIRRYASNEQDVEVLNYIKEIDQYNYPTVLKELVKAQLYDVCIEIEDNQKRGKTFEISSSKDSSKSSYKTKSIQELIDKITDERNKNNE
jgi:hypothetical protein